MTIHPANNEQYLLITVREGSYQLRIEANPHPYFCYYHDSSPVTISKKLPLGHWQLIGVASSLTEQEIETMVDKKAGLTKTIFKDYENAFKDYGWLSPQSSFASLLRHYNLQVSTTVILKRISND